MALDKKTADDLARQCAIEWGIVNHPEHPSLGALAFAWQAMPWQEGEAEFLVGDWMVCRKNWPTQEEILGDVMKLRQQACDRVNRMIDAAPLMLDTLPLTARASLTAAGVVLACHSLGDESMAGRQHCLPTAWALRWDGSVLGLDGLGAVYLELAPPSPRQRMNCDLAELEAWHVEGLKRVRAVRAAIAGPVPAPQSDRSFPSRQTPPC